MKRIMTPRVATVAFAASALAAAPALADPSYGHKHDYKMSDVSAAVHLNVGNGLGITLANGGWAHHHGGWHGNRGYNRNRGYQGYQDRYHIRELRREAIRLCKQAVKYESYNSGFRNVYLDDVERVEQIGPRGFKIRAEFEFEGRRRDFDKDVTCTVRRGRVVHLDNLPRPRGYRRAGYGQRGNDYRDYRHRGNH